MARFKYGTMTLTSPKPVLIPLWIRCWRILMMRVYISVNTIFSGTFKNLGKERGSKSNSVNEKAPPGAFSFFQNSLLTDWWEVLD